jgi:HEAT repeat protein
MPLFGRPNTRKRKQAPSSRGFVEALRDSDAIVRRQAIRALAEVSIAPKSEEFQALVAALSDEKAAVRQAAVEALARRPRRARNALLASLTDRSARVRWAAVKAVGKTVDTQSLRALGTALRDQDARVQQAAAERLLSVVKSDSVDEDTCIWIAKALGEGGEGTVPLLLAALRDPDSRARWAAARALGMLHDESAVDSLVNTLARDRNQDVRWAAAGALGELGAAAAPALAKLLQHRNEWVRWAAIGVLGDLRDARSVDGLVAALDDVSRDVRKAAVSALGEIGWPAVAALIVALGDDKTRVAASAALGAVGAPAVRPLIQALRNPDIRWAAVDALSEIGSDAVAPLTAAVNDQDQLVREAAAAALTVCSLPRRQRHLRVAPP